MAITPQAIKDQEFEVKFRGYDTVEVKAYLELIAEEFFELLEQVRQQIDEMDVVAEERDNLLDDKRQLENDLESSKGSSQDIKNEYANRDSEVMDLQNQLESLKGKIGQLEGKLDEKDKEVLSTKELVEKQEETVNKEREISNSLKFKLDNLEKMNEELRSEEIDLKSTLFAAQKFTDDMKKKSEKESREIIKNAKSEAERLRQATMAELASYPAEIERLKKKRNRVRDDLEETLKLCMESLEIFKEEDAAENYGELYEKIKFDNNGLIDTDELDEIDMDFNLPTQNEGEDGDVFSMKEEMENIREESSK